MEEESTEIKMADAVITNEMMAKMRRIIGTKLRIGHSVNNEEATRIAIRKFADGIGDPNPLWSDEEYAKKTKYGLIVAPPSWVFAVFSGLQFGWAGLGGFHSETDAEFYRPILRNDRISPECIYRGFEGPKPSSFAERIIIDRKENTYTNQNNELVARVKWSSIRVERAKAKRKGKYSNIQLPHPWTDEELKKIEEEVLAEEVRGTNVRYWEDTGVGEELKPVVKGPFGLTDMVAYCVGAQPVRLAAHGAQLRYYQEHPAFSFRDPETCALEPIYAVHYNKAAANAAGLPYQYNAGVQTQSWLIGLLTNWMGDEGWLKKNYAEYRNFVYFSDAVWFKGKVVKKYIDENGEYCVDIETHGINQREEDVAPGNSTVILPSREISEDKWPVARRLK